MLLGSKVHFWKDVSQNVTTRTGCNNTAVGCFLGLSFSRAIIFLQYKNQLLQDTGTRDTNLWYSNMDKCKYRQKQDTDISKTGG